MFKLTLSDFRTQLILISLTPSFIMLVLITILIFFPNIAYQFITPHPLTYIFFFSFAALLLISIIFLISLMYLRPLTAILKGTKQASQGDTNTAITSSGHPNLLEIAHYINQLMTKLNQTNQQYNQTVEHYNQDVNTLQSTLQQCQAALTTQQDQQELVLSGVTDGVIALDKSGYIQVYNKAAALITSYPTDYALGKHVDKILNIFESDRELETKEYCPEGKAEGIVFQREGLKLIGDNHKVSYVDVIVGRIKSTNSVDLSWIITLSDVTKEQNFQRMKLDFASMAAHELRTPLTTVQGYLSFLQDPNTLQKLSEAEQEFINKAAISSTRLNKLIENVLAVSKIEQGKLNLTFQSIQMADLIRRLINEYRGLAQTKDLQLIYTAPSEPLPEIMADQMRIEEVISNFIGNAVKYTNQGSIEVTLAKQGDYIITSVKDTGKGIPTDAIPNLFTKFFRVQSELKSGSKGTGLGLYITKTIVEAHNGKVWVESVLNQGSTFSFSLPITQPESAPKTENPQTTTTDQTTISNKTATSNTDPVSTTNQTNTSLPNLPSDSNIKLPETVLKAMQQNK